MSKTLSLSLTTMAQVVSGFLHCFETEMKPWCRRPAPSLSGTIRIDINFQPPCLSSVRHQLVCPQLSIFLFSLLCHTRIPTTIGRILWGNSGYPHSGNCENTSTSIKGTVGRQMDIVPTSNPIFLHFVGAV